MVNKPQVLRPCGLVSDRNRVVVEGAIGGISGALFIMILASAAGHSIFSQFQENIRYMAESLAGDPNVANFLGAELSENQRAELLQQIYEQAAELLPSTIAIFAAAGALCAQCQ